MTVFRDDRDKFQRESRREDLLYRALCWVSAVTVICLLTAGVVAWGIGEAWRWGR